MKQLLLFCIVPVVLTCLGPRMLLSQEAAATQAGTLEVNFSYMPPMEVDPTYATAIWLEDKSGKLVKTLFVSQELSVTEYKSGTACPDWVKKADWDKAEKPVVDAVTGTTPLIGGESKVFDLGALGVPLGTYEFRFEVHFIDEYNTLFRGELSVDKTASELKLETVYVPKKREGDQTVVESIRARYFPKVAQ